eukprot:TRINITY_DN7952_c0_g4_i1.p1 TRINITY_DN7952_c0_g4~~TRINITY_DN7952_c0_g4_i1.p1  ORF type:complete len:312 (+),score=18.20 TRINITY_DN7952_c0_g4_i1:86-1021(+)
MCASMAIGAVTCANHGGRHQRQDLQLHRCQAGGHSRAAAQLRAFVTFIYLGLAFAMSATPSSSSSSSYDLCQAIKLVVIGSEQTGKTSLISAFLHGSFEDNYIGTVGLDTSEKVVYLPHGKARAKLWDIGGHPRFRPLCPTYLKGADAVMIVYDATDRSTYEYALSAIKMVQGCGIEAETMLLVGNKHDNRSQLDVSQQEASIKSEELHVRHLAASAYDLSSVKRSFLWLVSKALFVEPPNWQELPPLPELADRSRDFVSVSVEDSSSRRTSSSSPREPPNCLDAWFEACKSLLMVTWWPTRNAEEGLATK